MRYIVTVDGRTYQVDIEAGGRVAVDGERVAADLAPLGQEGLFSLILDHAPYLVRFEREPGGNRQLMATIDGAVRRVQVQDERSRRQPPPDPGLPPPTGDIAVQAPIPGLVTRVAVEDGQPVAAGQTLVILEAMKMENDLQAPRAGRVAEVRVRAGDLVSLGQVVVIIQ